MTKILYLVRLSERKVFFFTHTCNFKIDKDLRYYLLYIIYFTKVCNDLKKKIKVALQNLSIISIYNIIMV